MYKVHRYSTWNLLEKSINFSIGRRTTKIKLFRYLLLVIKIHAHQNTLYTPITLDNWIHTHIYNYFE